MAHFVGLVVALLAAGSAWAASIQCDPPQWQAADTYAQGFQPWPIPPRVETEWLAACQGLVADENAAWEKYKANPTNYLPPSNLPFVLGDVTNLACHWVFTRATGTSYTVSAPLRGICPPGMTFNTSNAKCTGVLPQGYIVQGTRCVASCPTGQHWDGSKCAPDCVAGAVLAAGYSDMGTSPSNYPAAAGCYNGCFGAFQGDCPAGTRLVGGVTHYFCGGKVIGYGQSCTGGAPLTFDSALPPDGCGAGQSMGWVNGKPHCYTNDPNNPPTPSDPNPNPNPQPNPNDPYYDPNNPDGDPYVDPQNPDGTEEDPNDPCKDNPNAAGCVDRSFDGSCEGMFVCNGDAIQCAIAKEQHRRNCEFFEAKSAASELGQKVIEGTPEPVVGDPRTSPEVVDVGAAMSGVSMQGGGTCPLPSSLSVAGHSISLPQAAGCDLFQKLGYLLVAITSIACVRIIGVGGRV